VRQFAELSHGFPHTGDPVKPNSFPSDLVVGMVSPFQQCSVAPDQCSDAGLPMVLLRKTISDLSCLQTV
jgi:hypothetical protein